MGEMSRTQWTMMLSITLSATLVKVENDQKQQMLQIMLEA